MLFSHASPVTCTAIIKTIQPHKLSWANPTQVRITSYLPVRVSASYPSTADAWPRPHPHNRKGIVQTVTVQNKDRNETKKEKKKPFQKNSNKDWAL